MPRSSSPEVTVIVATFNKQETLYHAIQSILWQTFTDFECWIIGDACTDDSESVVDSFRDPRLRWHNLPRNSGYQSAPTNAGLMRAKGAFISYLNHDDLWLPNHLECQVTVLRRGSADFTFSILEWLRDGGHYAQIPEYPNSAQPPEVSATMHRRDVIDRIGYWKTTEETRAIPRVEFFRRAQFAGMSFELVPHLTAIKFDRSHKGYAFASQQANYVKRIQQEPDFAQNELAAMLIESYRQLSGSLSFGQVRFQLLQTMRKALSKRQIEPERLMPWLKPGSRIAEWRKSHNLDPK